MRPPLKVGVVGLGVGERHVATYTELPSCEVRVVCDLDPAKAAEVATRYDVPRHCTDWRAVTESPDLDIVSICTYDDCHPAQAASALRHGKHVMVEKPLALDRESAASVLEAWSGSGLVLTSNLILRASPRFREVRRLVREGFFGELFYLEGDYLHEILWKIVTGWRARMPGYSVVYGGGVHLVDLMRWVSGQEVVEVCGMDSARLTGGTGSPVPDTSVHVLRFEGGLLAKTTTSLGPQRTKFHNLAVYGTKATFLNDMPDAKLFVGTAPGDEERMTVPYPAIEKGDLLPGFVSAVLEGREPEVAARDVFRVMDVCFAAVEAAKTGRATPVRYSL